MVVVFGTLGFTAEKFLAALPSVGAQIERAVVYTGREVKPREKRLSDTALAKVRSVLQAMTIACDHKEFSSPWDFAEIARSMMMDLRGRPAPSCFQSDRRPEDHDGRRHGRLPRPWRAGPLRP